MELSTIAGRPSYVYLGRSMNMENDLKEDLTRGEEQLGAAFDPKFRYEINVPSRDTAVYVSKAKHRLAGQIMRRADDRWTLTTLEWIPCEAKRSRGATDQMG
ncbi:unnamed protein product [Strongylus vulgaris]|uniref:Uncharacterized protein n=1 Tax=Strongylus vulgaris TaxID=40348 RepID=A0A3P7JS34_STRVU|nr:unnamed protein product [Strongylus vulgaris]